MKKEDLQHLLENGEEVLMVDVREADEYAASDKHLEGAQNMPMGKVFVEAAQGHLPKDKKIVTICKTGGRCEIVAKELREKGYDIDFLEGGVEGWMQE
jgi:rhodanese-related sulfurtransferase